jgi:5-methyltetrahydrofolate--homocysteine methyltransferase
MVALEKLREAIVTGDQKRAVAITREAIAEEADPKELIDSSMVPAMDEVGRLFEEEEYFVPELLLAARAMKSALEILRPLLAAQGAEPAGRVVIGTIKGDLHDIGKNLVAAMLEGGGFEVVDLGTDVTPEEFAKAAEEKDADLVGLSALLTVTMPSMKLTIEALRAAGIRDRVKVLIGGAPVTPEFAAEIEADGFAENAASAVRMARQFIGK